jgi:hypothetical protein
MDEAPEKSKYRPRERQVSGGARVVPETRSWLDEIAIFEQIVQARIILYNQVLPVTSSSMLERTMKSVKSAEQHKDHSAVPISLMNGIDLTMTKVEHALLTDLTCLPGGETTPPTSKHEESFPESSDSVDERVERNHLRDQIGKACGVVKPGAGHDVQLAQLDSASLQIGDIFDLVAASTVEGKDIVNITVL